MCGRRLKITYSLSQLLGQDVVLAGKSALEQSSSLTGVDEVSELLVGDFHQGIKIDTSVGELLKGSLLSRHVCVGGAKKKGFVLLLPPPHPKFSTRYPHSYGFINQLHWCFILHFHYYEIFNGKILRSEN